MQFNIDATIEEWQKGLLDTSKRNRLIHFDISDEKKNPEIVFRAPKFEMIWEQLVVEEQKLVFPWKRNLINIPAEVIDAADSPRQEKPTTPVSTDIAKQPTQPSTQPKVNSSNGATLTQEGLSNREITARCLNSPKLKPRTSFITSKLSITQGPE